MIIKYRSLDEFIGECTFIDEKMNIYKENNDQINEYFEFVIENLRNKSKILLN